MMRLHFTYDIKKYGSKFSLLTFYSSLRQFVITLSNYHYPMAFLNLSISIWNRRMTSDPPAWFVSQFAAYLFRPQSETQEYFDDMADSYNYTSPVVG